MKERGRPTENERRDWVVILVILLIGFLCVILAGSWAIRFAPVWKLDTNMRSNLNPDSDFLTNRPTGFFEPLDPSILTQPVWINAFLTPGASFPTRTPVPPTNTPLPTNTLIVPSNTPTRILPSPTPTQPYFPPPTRTSIPNTPLSPTATSVPNTPVTPPTAISVDLGITKDDGVTSVDPGDTVTYTVRVINNGPNAVPGAILSDPPAAGLDKTSVLCSPTPGQCVTPPMVAQLESGTFGLPALNNGQFYEIVITAGVTASGGSVTNTAAVAAPAGYTDTNSGNNSASDINTVNIVADLQITITDNSTSYTATEMKTYEIRVTNLGPSDVTGATVSNVFMNGNATPDLWSCTPSAGASCAIGSFPGNITNEPVNLNNGSSVTFYLTAQVIGTPSGALVNTATVTSPTDPDTSNNSATDIDYGSTSGDLGTYPDGNIQNVTPEMTPLILSLSSSVIVVGAPDIGNPDIILYEQTNGNGIDMDQIVLDVSTDSVSWIPILNWGDGLSNPGTSIETPWPPSNSTDCSSEPDNCPIDVSLLVDYLGNGLFTGVTIDLDALVPAGTYSFVRIRVPNAAGIDGIYVVP